jgi:hypothetical protein
MGQSLFVTGASPSSVVADTKLKAMQYLAIALNKAEAQRNRANKNNQTNYVSWGIAADAATTFTTTVTVPAQMVENATTGEIDLVAEEPFDSTFLAFTAGDGDLAGAAGPCAALIKLATKVTYLETLIDPNIVVTQADQVKLTKDYENGQYVVALNFPINVDIDAATGMVDFNPFDYLRILEF